MLLPDGRLVEYDNDAIGRRVAKRIDGAIVEKYLWLGRTRLLAVLHADGSLKYRFEYADDRTPVAMTTGGQTYYLMYDQVGSLRAATDASGAIVKAVTYDSFGNVLTDSNPALDVPFGFAGGLHDADTGLVRFGYRDYAPEVGRWTAKDPIGFAGGDSDLYGYCGGDPVNFVDADGLAPLILPVNPSGLPSCWKRDLSHKNPYGSMWHNHVGETLEFHEGRGGVPGNRSIDHWHYNGGKGHLRPGEVIDATPCPEDSEESNMLKEFWDRFNDYMERIIPDEIPPAMPGPLPLPLPLPFIP